MFFRKLTTEQKIAKIEVKTKKIEALIKLQNARNKLYAMKRVRAKQRREYIRECARSVFGPASEAFKTD